MRLSKRFALSNLLLLMLVVASICGFAQWRRLRLKAEIVEINKLGNVMLTMPSNYMLQTPSRYKTRTFTTLSLEGDF
ncbi:hypothetical protein I41_27170 [Lacipirellula limnantheis]|uniref:Uncharacterized protein n=1 Tax=Lacipirellula limnantheis TaxID=2528024 RepID=A0A517TYT0_9BACT|nr:hypothetical protein I41_27170 [Lacipirellula limnantheis]